MVRHYKKLHYWDRFNFKHLAVVILGTVFMLYVGFIIMTPKSEVLQTLQSNGNVARLSKTYYQIAPLLHIQLKTKYRWRTLFIEPSSNKDFTTTWSEKNPELKWDSSGRYLMLSLNGSNVWHTTVE